MAVYTLLLLEFISTIVHLDLWAVVRYQNHLFAPLLYLIPQKQRKTYQGIYRESLKRRFFCVQDKIEVSGSTFTGYFTGIYAFLFFFNLCRGERSTSTLSFWVQGLPYYAYMLFCMTTYKDQRELCFYCKYGMAAGLLHFVIGLFTLEGSGLPWVFFLVCAVIMFFVIAAR